MRPVVRTSISFSLRLSGTALQRFISAVVAAKVSASTYSWASQEPWLMAMTSGGRQGMLGLLGFIYRISLSGILTKGVMDGSGMLWMVVRMLVDGHRCYRF